MIDKCFNLLPCKKCPGQQVEDKSGECNDCGKNKMTNADDIACVWKDSGCPEDQIQANGNVCRSCSGKQNPNSTGKKCVDPTSDKDKNKNRADVPKAKLLTFPLGVRILPRKIPSASPTTTKCPSGQIAASRRKGSTLDETYEPECGKDSNPEFKCKDLNTFDYKYFGKGGDRLVQHSCRATQESEKRKKETYQSPVDYAKAINEIQRGQMTKRSEHAAGGAGSAWPWLERGLIWRTTFPTCPWTKSMA